MNPRTLSIAEPVAEVLRRAVVSDGVVRLQGEQLDRKLYQDVNKVLEAVGGKWNRKLGGHVLGDPDAGAVLAEALETGAVTPADNHGYFPTPDLLVDRLLELAEVEPEHMVLEPSAGRGAIASRLREVVGPDRLYLVELQPKHAATLTGYRNLVLGGFLEATFPCRFDRVVMNPPFERRQDVDHVLRAYELLKPGGRLVSIMAASSVADKRGRGPRLTELVSKCGSVETNPPKSFKGTSVNTVIIVLNSADKVGRERNG